ncbi:MAG TPA: hypothetical protein VK728_12850 [Candidatus Sulfotelmatobacter sp.]|jgi:hypothetical protein|nr:hypothetical protein [Candidatus Sulfotelmatobacter sp.]
MKRRAFLLLGLSVSFSAGMILGGSKRDANLPTIEIAQPTDAAFRDGLYQATLDCKEGKKPHPAIGRWSTAEARASFLAGYQTGYRPSGEVATSRLTGPSIAELAAAGYRDGMLDGKWHRIASQPFQAEQTAKYLTGGAAYLGATATQDEFKHFYREGYVNGYQSAYFAQAKPLGEETHQ